MVLKQYITDAVEGCIKDMPEAFTSADMSSVVSKALGKRIDNRSIAWHLNALYFKGKLKKIRVSCNDSGNKANIFMKGDKEA
jgi:hypothetical protein